MRRVSLTDNKQQALIDKSSSSVQKWSASTAAALCTCGHTPNHYFCVCWLVCTPTVNPGDLLVVSSLMKELGTIVHMNEHCFAPVYVSY